MKSYLSLENYILKLTKEEAEKLIKSYYSSDWAKAADNTNLPNSLDHTVPRGESQDFYYGFASAELCALILVQSLKDNPGVAEQAIKAVLAEAAKKWLVEQGIDDEGSD